MSAEASELHIEPVYDGAAGLAKALSGKYALILLDVMLPVLDGFEVLRQLRRRLSVPVIMLTARGEQSDRVDGLNEGADDYIPKPFGPEELEARMRAVLRRTQPGAPRTQSDVTVGALRLRAATRSAWVRDQAIIARLTFAAEMVRKTEDREAAAVRLRHEIDCLSQLVRTLIDVTRVEGDPQAIQVAEIELTALVQTVVDDCLIEAAERGCSIRLSEDRTPVKITGNQELLRRAIENVIRNAIRYSPESTAVDVRLFAENGKANITVRDYGPGVPSESLEKIFRPFFRVDAARQELTGGVGLGLTIARRAVLAQQGAIAAENANPGLLVRIVVPQIMHGNHNES